MREALARVRAEMAECVDAAARVWALGQAELVDSLDEVCTLDAQLAVLRAHLVHEVERQKLPAAQTATGTAAWLRARYRVSIQAAKRTVELAAAVDRSAVLDGALGAGLVNPEQAAVIAAVVRQVPAELGSAVRDKAEATMLGFAGSLDPAYLRKVGDRILDHVAPELAEEAEAERLRRQEERARRARALYLTPVGQGRTRLTGWLDAEGAATLNAAIDPLCAPAGADDDRTPAQRRADALVGVCERALNAGTLPDSGGDRPQLVVTIDFDQLRRQLGSGRLDTGEVLSAAQVRRLACDAMILPAVLGGDGAVLDVGRARRLITGALRRALVLRDGGCAFPQCDRPARWCAGHHIESWVDGGATCLDNSVLLCGAHHRLIHRGDWQVRLGTDRQPEFIPPAHLDPAQRPRRNHYHRRP
jgi:hypothetical protein